MEFVYNLKKFFVIVRGEWFIEVARVKAENGSLMYLFRE